MRTNLRQQQNQRRRANRGRYRVSLRYDEALHELAADRRVQRATEVFKYWLERGADWSVAAIAGLAEL